MPTITPHGREWHIAIITDLELINIEVMSWGFMNKKDIHCFTNPVTYNFSLLFRHLKWLQWLHYFILSTVCSPHIYLMDYIFYKLFKLIMTCRRPLQVNFEMTTILFKSQNVSIKVRETKMRRVHPSVKQKCFKFSTYS